MKRIRIWWARVSNSLARSLAVFLQFFQFRWASGVTRIFQQMGRFFAFLFRTVVDWCASLNLRLLVQGLPALVVGLTCLTALAFAGFTQPLDIIKNRYMEEAQRAKRGAEEAKAAAQSATTAQAKDSFLDQAKEHYLQALACYERLASLQPENQEILYEWARTANAAGQSERCMVLMNQLASLERPGYARAHLWHAVKIMVGGNLTAELRRDAYRHLHIALEKGVEDKEVAHGLLGELELNLGALDKAAYHFEIAVKTNPRVNLRLAHLYRLKGDVDQSKSYAQNAFVFFSGVVKRDPRANGARGICADAQTYLENFPEAIKILEEGRNITGDPAYVQALGDLHAVWYDFLAHKPNVRIGECLSVLGRGLYYDPKNFAILERMLKVTGIKYQARNSYTLAATLVGLCGTNSPFCAADFLPATAYFEAEQAAKYLREAISQAPGLTGRNHFVLGMICWQQGDAEAAKTHLSQANELAGDIPAVANNLAWIMCHSCTERVDLEKALELSNKAIEKAPREVNFRHTRGEILFKMKNFKAALGDLEAALHIFPNSRELSGLLAEVYAQEGNPKMSAVYRKRANDKAIPQPNNLR